MIQSSGPDLGDKTGMAAMVSKSGGLSLNFSSGVACSSQVSDVWDGERYTVCTLCDSMPKPRSKAGGKELLGLGSGSGLGLGLGLGAASLPWQGLKAGTKKQKYEKISEKKMSTPIEVLCKNYPSELASFFHYCRSLRFDDKPDYAYLKRLFRDLFIREGRRLHNGTLLHACMYVCHGMCAPNGTHWWGGTNGGISSIYMNL